VPTIELHALFGHCKCACNCKSKHRGEEEEVPTAFNLKFT